MKHSICIIPLILFSFVPAAWACDVPVFRYALERWPADYFEVYLLHRGELTAEEQEHTKWLEEHSSDEVYYSNYNLHIINLGEKPDHPASALLEKEKEDTLPKIFVRYPIYTRIPENVWTGPLTEQSVRAIPDSPVRHEIAKRILQGDSAVWVLLESGNPEKDEAAAKLLEEQLANMEEQLILPEPVLALSDQFDDEEFDSALKIQFSMLRLSKSNPDEELLVNTLMRSEPDLYEYESEPMVFPIYGRARILFALVGPGINEMNILDACAFITGPCSCEVKGLNPGTDMLVAVDWDAAIMNRVVDKVDEAFLLGTNQLIRTEPVIDTNPESLSSGVVRNIVVAAILLILLNGIIAFVIYTKKSSKFT